ncbi:MULTISPECIES: DUF2147 domain-containing protein [unclassified Bradyrhizobium]|uniref:DUF2147 domain-containing protein n=1 Tax=unclassified Bradyrhizobium TaxID=2631580 RepID=UPI00140E27C5|nr:DUF2147 domain-containing protein [Bradyrhizobium sp. 2S1]MCK7671434.1 DUF2147 domain-containing protein [Bradyrhizobium sp. 2S1]
MLHCPRTFARTIAFSGLFLATVLSPALAADPTGDWKVADGVATIRVAQCNGNMWGAVSWEKTPGGKDKNNPDPAKQSRPTLGMPILIDMKKKAGVDAWEGQVYNAKDGQLYSSTIKPVGTDQLEIQGCVLGFLCGGETWTRVSPPIPVSVAGNPAAKGALPKTAAPQTPKTTGVVAPATKPAQKQAVNPPANANASADLVGDICLLPDIAKPTR